MSGNATTYAWRASEDDMASADAARLLDVSAETLEHWSRQFAFPCDVGSAPCTRFRLTEIEALRATLPSAHCVEGAIREAQRKLGA
jgi:hypothetical protein